MQLEQLQRRLQSIEPAALLVEPRVLRRVIRLDRRLQGFRLTIPHELSYTIDRDRLLAFVDLSELAVPPSSDLPRRIILLAQPDDVELSDDANRQELTDRYRRLLFHACAHLELEDLLSREPFVDTWAKIRRRQIGEVEFLEIREVLLKEDLLFPPPADAETYVEFAAVALELECFAPQDLPSFFPAIRDWQSIKPLFQQDLDVDRLLQRFSPVDGNGNGNAAVRYSDITGMSGVDNASVASGQRISPLAQKSPVRTGLSAVLGRWVNSAIAPFLGSRVPANASEADAQAAAESNLTRLTERLQNVLGLTEDERERWRTALQPLLAPAAEGFRSDEARLLYDLQKVCSEQERGVYRLDLLGWLRTFGKLPIRRPLPLMQDILTLRHLRTVRRRTATARMTPAERTRLVSLLDGVLPRMESQSRERLRGIINDVFDDVGFVPGNVLEIVSRKKLVEELVDRIVERSYVSMADLRDAISKNDLKLADVTTISELTFGTCLLRADRRFDSALDGVYRRGAVYLRWPQTLSSVVFGTNIGRFLTQHLIVPFGGAFLLLAFLRHASAMFIGDHTPDEGTPDAVPPGAIHLSSTGHEAPGAYFLTGVLILGLWLSMLIHRPEFRAWNVAVLRRGWRIVRRLTVDLPSLLLNSPFVRRILGSRTFAVLRSYALEPGLLAGLIFLIALLQGADWGGRAFLELFLATALLLNSPVGRSVSERTIDFLVRTWQELKMHVFAALIRSIMDIFDRFFTVLERVVYSVDEWLRFRSGDNRATQGIKLAGSAVWFIVSYVMVFVFTLLVEPQINPIKHFPVVTVAHKLILPAGPMFVASLTPYLGGASAQTLVWTTIWLIPGVFGFLVWELRENWKLYAANRSERIDPAPIGEHGETMMRLLRPGIHSGTLPKAYTALRRAVKKGGVWEENRLQTKRAAILHVEEAVRHFVERELIALLEVADVLPQGEVTVGSVHAATNRIDVELLRADALELPMRLTWEYRGGELVGSVDPPGWLVLLSEDECDRLSSALAELFQRAGVERVQGPLRLTITPPITRQESISFWSRREIPVELAIAHQPS